MSNFNIHRPDADPRRPRYVVMNNEKTSVLMVPYGRGGKLVPWWSYAKNEAELMLKVLEKDFNQRGFVIEYRQAIVLLSNYHAALAEKLQKEQGTQNG